MVLVGDEYHSKLFVRHVDDLQQCGQIEPRGVFERLKMAHTLRLLVTEGKGNELAFRVQERYSSPLWVLVPEPISGNTPIDQLPDVPDEFYEHATPITEERFPFGTDGYYHKPYALEDYLQRPLGVLMRRSIVPREIIKFLANKMGGSHVDDELVNRPKNVDAETLYFLNKNISIFGEGAIYDFFDNAAPFIWRSLIPLRNEVVRAFSGKIDL
jgi:hypothetical protein